MNISETMYPPELNVTKYKFRKVSLRPMSISQFISSGNVFLDTKHIEYSFCAQFRRNIYNVREKESGWTSSETKLSTCLVKILPCIEMLQCINNIKMIFVYTSIFSYHYLFWALKRVHICLYLKIVFSSTNLYSFFRFVCCVWGLKKYCVFCITVFRKYFQPVLWPMYQRSSKFFACGGLG